jgi:hypothetical protein
MQVEYGVEIERLVGGVHDGDGARVHTLTTPAKPGM